MAVWTRRRGAYAIVVALFLTAGCGGSANPPAKGDTSPDASPSAASALGGASDCAELVERYLTLERDSLLDEARAAVALRDTNTLPTAAPPAPRVGDAELTTAVTQLGCEEQFPGLLHTRLTALAGEIGVPVAAIPVAQKAAQPPPEYHWHYGRTYLFSMLPKGELTPVGDAPADFGYGNFDLRSNTYRDEAGNEWKLYRPYAAAYHQPPGGDGSPNKKFVVLDSRAGSFEAVLMPDGATPTSPATPPYSYRTGNWLTSGAQIGTYNYIDSGNPIGHFFTDMIWHRDAVGYAPVPENRWLDPDGDWNTYVQRYLDQVAPIGRGARIVRDENGRLYRAEAGPDGKLIPGDPIDADLASLALDLAMAMKAEPPLVTLGGLGSAPGAPVDAAALAGRWTGTYVCAQGLTALRLTIEAVDRTEVRATFGFSAVPSNPNVPTGSYTMSGSVDAGRLVLETGRWIQKPPTYVMVGLMADARTDPATGTVSSISGTTQGPGCTWFRIDRG